MRRDAELKRPFETVRDIAESISSRVKGTES
jgi:hypothetical protein